MHVYSISAIVCSSVARNIREPRQPAAHFEVNNLLINIHESHSLLPFMD